MKGLDQDVSHAFECPGHHADWQVPGPGNSPPTLPTSASPATISCPKPTVHRLSLPTSRPWPERTLPGRGGLAHLPIRPEPLTTVPKRTDLESILILGSGPIIIGQACEFDYSGTQAVRALKEEGYRVVLVNSNPATIMTDPDLADRTYIEPLSASWVERVIEAEEPDALLPTMGGQTALNLAMELHERGVLERHGIELIGANATSIQMAEDREAFTEACTASVSWFPMGGLPGPWTKPWSSWRTRGTRRLSVPLSLSAGPVEGSRTTCRSSRHR